MILLYHRFYDIHPFSHPVVSENRTLRPPISRRPPIDWNRGEKIAFRSMTRKRFPVRKPSSQSVRFRAICSIHAEVGWTVVPTSWTRRVATANPASERSQEKLQMDGFNHAASVSEVQQVIALKCDRVFGHYAIASCSDGVFRRDTGPRRSKSIRTRAPSAST